jgi:hypothetical protein
MQRVSVSEEAAWQLAKDHFGPGLADWVRLERMDFGWLARVEEPPAGPEGLIGRDVLAIGPTPEVLRTYPAMPPPQLRHAHLSWLDAAARVVDDPDGPGSFS